MGRAQKCKALEWRRRSRPSALASVPFYDQSYPLAFLIEDHTKKSRHTEKKKLRSATSDFPHLKSGVKRVVAAQGRYVDDTPTPMSVSSEPKAKEIDDKVSENSDSGVAAPTRHVKMRARQDKGLRSNSNSN